MNPVFAKSLPLIPLSLMLISCFAFAESAKSQTGEHYEMDGKPVPKSFYEAGLLVTDANNLIRANRYQEASVKLKDAVAIAPEFAEAHYNYGISLAKLGNNPSAVEQFHTALKLKPSLDQCWISLGGLYQSSGQIPDAIASYKEFITRFPRSSQVSQITALIKGLQQEIGNEGTSGSVQLQLGMTAPATVSADDYLADVTRRGTMRWPADHPTIRVYMAPPVRIIGFVPKYDTIARQAFSDWANATAGAVKFQFQSTPANADIEFAWICDANKLQNRAEAGECRLTTNRFGIVHGLIHILTVPMTKGVIVTPNSIRTISLHEIGHVLGLTGHTSNPNDTMFFSTTIPDEWRKLSPRDINSMTRLYSPNTTASVTNGP